MKKRKVPLLLLGRSKETTAAQQMLHTHLIKNIVVHNSALTAAAGMEAMEAILLQTLGTFLLILLFSMFFSTCHKEEMALDSKNASLGGG